MTYSTLNTSSAFHKGLGLFIGSLIALAPLAAAAKDLSLPYRHFPGFTCNRWNAQGECSDFSYFDQGMNTGNAYRAPSYYPSTYVYPAAVTPVYNYQNTYQNCYDQYGRYNVSYCNNTNTNYYGNVTVRVTGSPNPVYQNDLLTYSVYLRNDSSTDRTIDVRAFLDPQTIFHSASDRGQSLRTDEVLWTRMLVRRNSSKTLSLSVRVDDAYRNDNYYGSRNCYDTYGRYDTRYCSGSSLSNSTSTIRLRVEAGGATDDVTTDVRGSTNPNNRYSDNCYDQYGRYDSRYCSNTSSSRYGNCYDSYGRYNSSYCY